MLQRHTFMSRSATSFVKATTLVGVFTASACTGGLSSQEGEGEVAPALGQPGDGSTSVDTPAGSLPAEAPPIAAGDEFACDPAVAGSPQPQARRLTAIEYANTTRDLLGVEVSGDVTRLPDAAPIVHAFNNQGLLTSQSHTATFESLAEIVVGKLDVASLIEKHAPGCAAGGAACEDAIIQGLGTLLFRAPPVDAEQAALKAVFGAAAAEDFAFAEAVPFVLSAMLQSPRFLFRIEPEVGNGSSQPVSPYAMASRLSFSLWQSAPDQDLLDAAERAQLASDAELSTQVDRMLADPRAAQAMVTFLDDWMDLYRMGQSDGLQDKYPDFDLSLQEDMRAETLALFTRILEEKLPITAMFNLQTTTVSRRLAEFYGFENPQEGVAEYDLTDMPERGGLLTQGSMSSLGGTEGSTVQAGLHLLNEVLCGVMADPPPNVNAEPTPAQPGESIRASSEARVNNPSCGGCHAQFEPLVWGMTRFRPTGEYAETDLFGNALPEDGWIIFPDDLEQKHVYANPAEMMDLLATSARVRDCVLLKTSEYFGARSLRETDACSLQAARDSLPEQATMQDIVTAVVLSPNFRNVRTSL